MGRSFTENGGSKLRIRSKRRYRRRKLDQAILKVVARGALKEMREGSRF